MVKRNATEAIENGKEMKTAVLNLYEIAERGNAWGDEVIDALEILRMKEGDDFAVLVAAKALGKTLAAVKFIYEKKGVPFGELLNNEMESFLLGFKLNPEKLQYL